MTSDEWRLIVGAAVLVVAAALVWGVTRAAARGSLRVNSVAGMRTPATMSSPEAWQAGHRSALPWTNLPSIACAVLAVVAVVSNRAGAELSDSEVPLMAGMVLLVVGAVGGGVRAHLVARKVRSGRS